MRIIFSKLFSAFKPSGLKTNWKYQFQQYGEALAVVMFLFAVLSVYLFYRRGYYDPYIANKVFANAAAMILGIILLIVVLPIIYIATFWRGRQFIR